MHIRSNFILKLLTLHKCAMVTHLEYTYIQLQKVKSLCKYTMPTTFVVIFQCAIALMRDGVLLFHPSVSVSCTQGIKSPVFSL